MHKAPAQITLIWGLMAAQTASKTHKTKEQTARADGSWRPAGKTAGPQLYIASQKLKGYNTTIDRAFQLAPEVCDKCGQEIKEVLIDD